MTYHFLKLKYYWFSELSENGEHDGTEISDDGEQDGTSSYTGSDDMSPDLSSPQPVAAALNARPTKQNNGPTEFQKQCDLRYHIQLFTSDCKW